MNAALRPLHDADGERHAARRQLAGRKYSPDYYQRDALQPPQQVGDLIWNPGELEEKAAA